MKQMTPCMGLQEDSDDIYKRNITKIQKFKKSFFQKRASASLILGINNI